MMTTIAYRDDAEGAAIRLADLVSRRAGEDRALGDVRRARGRRVARITAGVAGIAGAATLAGTTAASYLAHAHLANGTLTAMLFGAWPIMGLAYVAGRVDWWRRAGRLAVPVTRARDIHAEIARLEQDLSGAPVREQARRLERASVALPLIAVALLAPLTLHALVYAVAWHNGFGNFDEWIALSLAIVGHAHLVLAWQSWRFATAVRASSNDEIRAGWSRAALRAFGYTVLTSAIPGIVLILLPPVLTAITAVAFVPALFYAVAVAVVKERRLIDPEA